MTADVLSDTTTPDQQFVRRACLFAGFDPTGVVQEATLRYVRELARFADVYCLFDCFVAEQDLEQVRRHAAGAWSYRHGRGPVGSYGALARDFVGWDQLRGYDEVLFVDDTTFLIRRLDPVFARLSGQPADWWGLIAAAEPDDGHLRVDDAFVALRRPMVARSEVRGFLDLAAASDAPGGDDVAELDWSGHLLYCSRDYATFLPEPLPGDPLRAADALELITGCGIPLLSKTLLSTNPQRVPDLSDWRVRLAGVDDDTLLDAAESSLLRTAPHDLLNRSFAFHRSDDGKVRGDRVLSGRAFVERDKGEPKRPDLWVFVVDSTTHELPENSIAIFDQVATDPSLTKIILTRSTSFTRAGCNVISEPVLSSAGRAALLAAGAVFVADNPRTELGVPAELSGRQVVCVRRGLQLMRHGRTTAQAVHPGAERPPVVGSLPALHQPTRRVISALLTASSIDHVAEVASSWPARYPDAWRTGLPLHDHIVADELPPDLAEQEARLRTELAGRRLLVFVPIARRTGSSLAPYEFSQAEVGELRRWARAHGVVIGLREPPGDFERPYSASLADVIIDLSAARYPSTATVLRVADALLTDYDGSALDFLVTDRPVISFAHDLARVSDRLLYDLNHIFPGPVCRDFDALSAELGSVFDGPDVRRSRRRERVCELLLDHRDALSADRVVRHLRDLAGAESA